ncbi:Protein SPOROCYTELESS like [Actinidia chinensis var. chinensis]|uniref:Protein SPOROCYTELESS like n=1 Tax=Actinidia chinensis var. chinensis TaxID=1590841 RepID=A0A2R6QDG6_ACTCC|nr:Protein SPOROCYTELESS like [Actinidia chinensis var. chinensis]
MATTVLTAENARQGGRRKAKSGEAAAQKVKKQPQRGMGVAQLERLRLQERWNNMTEIGNVPPQPLSLHNSYSLSLNSYPIPVSTTQFGHGLNPAFFRNGSVEGVFPGQFQADPYRIGAPNPSVRAGNVGETSTELPSIPNLEGFSDHFIVCHKKKRVDGENLGCKGRNEKHIDLSPFNNGCGFQGFNQELEVLAVHRKGISGVVMEYEFFPGIRGRGICSQDLELGLSEVSVTTTSTGFDASNSVDLSLKLSY